MFQEMNNNNIELNVLDEMLREEEERTESIKKINAPIFRFKFTEAFMEDLYKFSKIHQYDHRKDFKEAWTIWIEENNDIIDEEVERLLALGYDGDILDKMFKSARYYFRKKRRIR
jgi:hypothetical protein